MLLKKLSAIICQTNRTKKTYSCRLDRDHWGLGRSTGERLQVTGGGIECGGSSPVRFWRSTTANRALVMKPNPSYLSPLVFRHGLQVVCGHQLLQHPGNRDKLAFVVANLYSEKQSRNVDHVCFGDIMVASQVLRQLLEDRRIFHSLSPETWGSWHDDVRSWLQTKWHHRKGGIKIPVFHWAELKSLITAGFVFPDKRCFVLPVFSQILLSGWIMF